MKKYLLFFGLCCSISFAKAQNPVIGTTTVIPQNPTINDFIKIVTKVTTPNQGVMVDTSHTVTGLQIKIKGCYSNGMLPATQTYVDTFMIGQLPAGTYQILQKAYLTSAQQWCNATDSSFVTSTLMVSGFTGMNENKENTSFNIYPNPVSEALFLGHQSGQASIFSVSGALVKQVMLMPGTAVNIYDLPEGLYFIRIKDQENSFPAKFVKVRQE